MATLIELATMGNRRAMETLYATNKQKVYYLATLLGGSENVAEAATVTVFKNVWENIPTHNIKTEAEFSHFLLRRVTDFCKTKILRKDSKAFRIPQNRNFLIANVEVSNSTESAAETVGHLPALQRYIFILHTVGGYRPEQIAGTFKFDMKTVDFALGAEKNNIERILHFTNQSEKSYEKISSELRDGEKQVKVPSSVDLAVLDVIDGIARPVEEKKQSVLFVVGVVCVALLALILALVLIIPSESENTDDDYEDYYYDTSDSDETPDSSVISEPVVDLDETLTYYADIEIANYGTITVQLDQAAAPVTVSNFISLAESGFYDGLTFH